MENSRNAQASQWTAMQGLKQALAGLRGLSTAAAVMDVGARELCAKCGFSRVMLFRVKGSEIVLEGLHLAAGKELESVIWETARTTVPKLDHVLRETDMFRRRESLLVTDPQHDDRVFGPLIEATRTAAYVAAPILPQDTVIGFVHADRFGQAAEVDEHDRLLLAAFAEGFGFALERAVLRERLDQQRTDFERVSAATKAIIDDAYDEVVSLSRSPSDVDEPKPDLKLVVAAEGRLDALLTRRELEVLRLMADGATNGSIGNQLVISESTVKTHVRQVMRKLHAANRADAVSRFHRMERLGERPRR